MGTGKLSIMTVQHVRKHMYRLLILCVLLSACGRSVIDDAATKLRTAEAELAKVRAVTTEQVTDARGQVVKAKAQLAEAESTLNAEIEQKRLAAIELRRERIENVISIVTWVCTVLGFLATFGLVMSMIFSIPIPKSLFIAVIAASAITLAVGQAFGSMLGLLPLIGLVVIIIYVLISALIIWRQHMRAATHISDYSDTLEKQVLAKLKTLNVDASITDAIDLLVDDIKNAALSKQIVSDTHGIVQKLRGK